MYRLLRLPFVEVKKDWKKKYEGSQRFPIPQINYGHLCNETVCTGARASYFHRQGQRKMHAQICMQMIFIFFSIFFSSISLTVTTSLEVQTQTTFTDLKYPSHHNIISNAAYSVIFVKCTESLFSVSVQCVTRR